MFPHYNLSPSVKIYCQHQHRRLAIGKDSMITIILFYLIKQFSQVVITLHSTVDITVLRLLVSILCTLNAEEVLCENCNHRHKTTMQLFFSYVECY